MYYQNYEDYMKNVLGYSIEPNNTYEMYSPFSYNQRACDKQGIYNKELLDLYPEIYRIINPMICKICELNKSPITPKLIDAMTDEIYKNIESKPEINSVINVRVSTTASNSEANTINNQSKNNTRNANIIRSQKEKNNKADENSTQPIINNTLKDLIKILILNELLCKDTYNPYQPTYTMAQIKPQYQGDSFFYDNYLRY